MEKNNQSSVDRLIANAREAMSAIQDYDQDATNQLVQAVAWAIYQEDHAQQLAELAVQDSGLGNVKDKFAKNRRKTFGTLRDLMSPEAKSVGVISENETTGIIEIAKPVGVVAAVVPSTNPAATPANKSMMALKGKNAIILAPSPKGASSCQLLLSFIYKEFDKIGAPHNLVQMLPMPITKESTQELLEKADFVTVTGSQRNVRNGQTCGTPNACVGQGNVVSIIDETADIEKAVALITKSKTFDNATSCSSDNAIVVEASIYDKTREELKKQKAYLCTPEEKSILKDAMWDPQTQKRRGQTTGKNSEVIAKEAGFNITNPEDITFFVVEEEGIGKEYPFSGEKLALVAALYKADDFNDALKITQRILQYQGRGHSCGLHTTNDAHIYEVGKSIDVCRIMINQAQAVGNGGSFDNGMNFTLSMGGGSWGRNNIGENLNYKRFINVTKVSKVIPEVIPTEEELFGPYWSKAGK